MKQYATLACLCLIAFNGVIDISPGQSPYWKYASPFECLYDSIERLVSLFVRHEPQGIEVTEKAESVADSDTTSQLPTASTSHKPKLVFVFNIAALLALLQLYRLQTSIWAKAFATMYYAQWITIKLLHTNPIPNQERLATKMPRIMVNLIFATVFNLLLLLILDARSLGNQPLGYLLPGFITITGVVNIASTGRKEPTPNFFDETVDLLAHLVFFGLAWITEYWGVLPGFEDERHAQTTARFKNSVIACQDLALVCFVAAKGHSSPNVTWPGGCAAAVWSLMAVAAYYWNVF